MTNVAQFLKTHTSANNSTDYTPVFTDLSGPGRETSGGSVGSYSPAYFGVHNPTASAQSITVWTVDQGTGGSGVTVYLTAGATFYARIAKLTVSANVTLLGSTNIPSLV
jgi:hypothetical protein